MMESDSKPNLAHADYYFNRELSWLDFNKRVLEEAKDPQNPLLEQLNFLSIASSNLDEFYMVRVAGLQDQFKLGYHITDSKTDMSPIEQLSAISKKNSENIAVQYKYYYELLNKLAEKNIRIKKISDLSESELAVIEETFDEQIFPALTPLGIDAYRPFPNLNNKLIHIFVNLEKKDTTRVAIVPVPAPLQRFILLDEDKNDIGIVLLEDVVRHFIHTLFKGFTVTNSFSCRITRNADLELHEDGADDLLVVIQDYLKKRKNGMAVRLEVDTRDTIETLQGDVRFLQTELDLEDRDVYMIDGPLDLTFLSNLTRHLAVASPDDVYPSFSPVIPSDLSGKNIFDVVENQDVFLHHPYDSFDPVVDFIKSAAEDEDTIAIKQTLYRVSKDSPIIEGLKTAAESGKQVTVLVELKARFDEENNVQWAKELEEAGAHVLYGMTHLKTHSKITMVVKKQNNSIIRYVHLATGNYNDKTARLYTDMAIFTANKEIGEDATNFFNYLSGYSDQPEYNHLHVSPFEIRDSFIEYIDDEIASHKQFGNGHIIAKMNSLTDKRVIMKLYEASQAGVRVDLIIRGICGLKPQVPGVSENIHVRSIVGRFLEHSRVYYFHHNGDENLFLSSADMMTRNMIKRVEIEFPILDKAIKKEILSLMDVYLADNTKARELHPDGTYRYVRNDNPKVDAQKYFMELANKEKEIPTLSEKDSWLKKIQRRFKK
ncbi:RNA degradosome polyphosphate kinase [Trichococcus pasteurii]|uniref:Polyphosphate kinase n=2 Tax=root TaxID=1 RepID=A0A1W1IFA1_9LACT|nr:RNA degradosome polyphosphate kinase [Trichococcus pasteurii]SFE16899.1 polyphosphate kinase [Trichococcus pasteurii]SLM51581.1 polyphosphate kinase [Trichococcus pasteurii]SSB92462.1 polyphosphate kinase [Trichococcus pasteurii]